MRYLLFFCCLCAASLTAQTVGSTSTGLASYFAKEFHGSKTSYGEIYDRNDLVAAHKLYDHNAIVKVTNLENGKTVRVRIIDKGPFIKGRIIELSHRAAELLGMLGQNTARVTIELVDEARTSGRSAAVEPSTRSRTDEPAIVAPPPPGEEEVAIRKPSTPPAPATRRETKPARPRTYETVVEPKPAPQPQRAAAARPSNARRTSAVTYSPSSDPITKGRFGDGVYQVQLNEAGEGNYGVQVASLSTLESAMQEVIKLQAKFFDNVLVKKTSVGGTTSYKVILGPFVELDSAQRYAKDLKKRYKINGFTTELVAVP